MSNLAKAYRKAEMSRQIATGVVDVAAAMAIRLEKQTGYRASLAELCNVALGIRAIVDHEFSSAQHADECEAAPQPPVSAERLRINSIIKQLQDLEKEKQMKMQIDPPVFVNFSTEGRK